MTHAELSQKLVFHQRQSMGRCGRSRCTAVFCLEDCENIHGDVYKRQAWWSRLTFGGSACVTVFFRGVCAFFPKRTARKSSNPYPSPRLSMRAAFSQPESFSRYDFPRFETSQPYSRNSFSSSSKSAGLCDNALSIATRSSSR